MQLGNVTRAGQGLLSRAPCPIPYLIEQFVVETTVYPVDAHVSEEEEGQHAEEDTRPAWGGGTGLLEVAHQEAVRVSTGSLWWDTQVSHVRGCLTEVTGSGCTMWASGGCEGLHNGPCGGRHR